MNVLSVLASHWFLALLVLVAALAAIIRGMAQILVSSMQRTGREESESGDVRSGKEPSAKSASAPDRPATFPRRTASILAWVRAWITGRVPTGRAVGEIRETFAAAFQYLSNRMPERAEQIPLYLLTGPPQAGKSTLLAQARLPWRWRQNQRTFGAASGMQWTFCEQGVVLELPGGVLPGRALDDTENAGAVWKQLPRLLLRHRPRRPLDGLVLVLPASLLLPAPSQNDMRCDRAEGAGCSPAPVRWSLRSCFAGRQAGVPGRWKELQRTASALAMRLPLYVIVSKCDLIPGFNGLVDELPAHKREDALGWSNPRPAEAEADAPPLDQACDALHRMFLRLTAEAAMNHDLRRQAAGEAAWLPWVELDRHLPALLDNLRLALTSVLASAGAAPLRLRGIYFCGDIGERTRTVADAGLPPTPPASSGRPARQIGFCETLLLQRVFPERGIAAPAATARLARQPRALAMQLTAAALLLGLGIGATTQALQLKTWREQRVLPLLSAMESTRPAPPLHVLQGMVLGGGRPLRSWLLPASLFSGIDTALDQRMRQTMQTRVYPGLAQHLQQQARRLAQHWVAVAADPRDGKAAPPLSRPDQLAEFAALQRFSRDWMQLQDAIDAYQGLAHADHPPSPAEAQRFLIRLGAPPASPLTASAPVYRALLAAHGPAFVYSPGVQNQASQVMRALVRRLLYRWYLGNELIVDLQRLGRLPGTATESRARARLTRRIRKELADPRLASVLQDKQPPMGPLYGVTVTVVDRSGYLDAGLRAFIESEASGDAQQARSITEQLRTPSGSALIALKNGHWQLTAAPDRPASFLGPDRPR